MVTQHKMADKIVKELWEPVYSTGSINSYVVEYAKESDESNLIINCIFIPERLNHDPHGFNVTEF